MIGIRREEVADGFSLGIFKTAQPTHVCISPAYYGSFFWALFYTFICYICYRIVWYGRVVA